MLWGSVNQTCLIWWSKILVEHLQPTWLKLLQHILVLELLHLLGTQYPPPQWFLVDDITSEMIIIWHWPIGRWLLCCGDVIFLRCKLWCHRFDGWIVRLDRVELIECLLTLEPGFIISISGGPFTWFVNIISFLLCVLHFEPFLPLPNILRVSVFLLGWNIAGVYPHVHIEGLGSGLFKFVEWGLGHWTWVDLKGGLEEVLLNLAIVDSYFCTNAQCALRTIFFHHLLLHEHWVWCHQSLPWPLTVRLSWYHPFLLWYKFSDGFLNWIRSLFFLQGIHFILIMKKNFKIK